MSNQPHSITRHPLRAVLTDAEWKRLRQDVQACRVSWPIGIEIGEPIRNPPAARPLYAESSDLREEFPAK